MRRQEFIALLGSAVVSPLTALTARAQQSRAKIPRLCFLTFDPGTRTRVEPFFQGLHDLGYVDGQSIAIDHLSADGQGERFPALAADCLRLKADIIVTTTTPATQAAKNVIRTIPVVMLPLGDPVGTGLVASLPRPGGNVTGLTFMASGLAAKRLERSLLCERPALDSTANGVGSAVIVSRLRWAQTAWSNFYRGGLGMIERQLLPPPPPKQCKRNTKH